MAIEKHLTIARFFPPITRGPCLITIASVRPAVRTLIILYTVQMDQIDPLVEPLLSRRIHPVRGFSSHHFRLIGSQLDAVEFLSPAQVRRELC